MDREKRARLEAAGFRVGSAAEFLELSEADSALVNMKLALSQSIRSLRTRKRLSQLFRAHLALGATRETLAEVISSVQTSSAQE